MSSIQVFLQSKRLFMRWNLPKEGKDKTLVSSVLSVAQYFGGEYDVAEFDSLVQIKNYQCSVIKDFFSIDPVFV